ncbi:MAG: hypothetical protein ACM3PF_08680 [Bacteroidota bacterium]
MGSAAVKPADRPVEIRIRFEPGLGAALYASLREGETQPLTVARMLGRGKALLYFHGVTLMAHGAPEWKPGETFPVVVKELGPPLVLAPLRAGRDASARVTIVDSSVVPGSARPRTGDAPGARG